MQVFLRTTSVVVHQSHVWRLCMGTDGLMGELRNLLKRAIEAKYEGSMHVKKAQAQAYADGYMRALLDADLVQRDALMRVVTEERERFSHSA